MIKIINIVTGGGGRPGPLSCEKRWLVTVKLCMLSRPEIMPLHAPIDGYGHKDSLQGNADARYLNEEVVVRALSFGRLV